MAYSFTQDLMGGLPNVMAGYPALQSAMTGGIQPQQVPVTPPFAIPELNTPEAQAAMGVTNPYTNMSVPSAGGIGDVPLGETPGYAAMPEIPTGVETPSITEDPWGFMSTPQMQLALMTMGTQMMGGKDIGSAFAAGTQAYQSYEDRKNAQAQRQFENEMSVSGAKERQVSGEKDRALRKRGQDIDLESLDFRAKDATADRQFRKNLAAADADLRIQMQAQEAENKKVLEHMKGLKDTGTLDTKVWTQALNTVKAAAGVNPETLEPNPVSASEVYRMYNSMVPAEQRSYLTANSKDVSSIMDELGMNDGDLPTQQATIDMAVATYGPNILPIIQARLQAAAKDNETAPNPDPMPAAPASTPTTPTPVTAPPAYMMPQQQMPSPSGYPFSFMGG